MKPEIKTPPPGPKALEIIAKDRHYSSPSLIKEYPLVVKSGEGVWITDVDNNRYLDLMAGIAVAATGHSHPKVVSAIKNAADKFLHICGTDFYYQSFADLCERLASYLPLMGQKKVFLTNSGTEAVDGAIKLARYHTKRPYIIAFKGAFHGRTMGAISLNSSKAKQRAFYGPLVPGIFHVPFANQYRCPKKQCGDYSTIESCATSCSCAEFISKELFSTTCDPREVAAIFIEPILGEGGYVLPPQKFLEDLRKICDEHQILLVFDEIQTGIGRTGRMFAAEHFSVMPDIFLLAKGLASGMPIGAIVAKESVMSWPSGSHGSTFGGNPVCCEAALATLDVIEPLLENIRRNGTIFFEGLKKLQAKHPEIGDVRGPGLMIGVEFIKPEFIKPGTKEANPEFVSKLEQAAFRNGLLLLSCGQSVIRIAPPLIISEEEIKTALELLDTSISQIK